MAKPVRPRNPKFVTPKGIFKFPKLVEPDTKFKPDGEYSVKLILNHADIAVKLLLAELEPLHRQAIEKGDQTFEALPLKTRKQFEAKGIKNAVVSPLYGEIYDETTDEPTGQIEMTFKMAAAGFYKSGPREGQRWTNKPTLYDARGIELTKPPVIWGGTEGKVAFEVGLDKTGQPGYFVPSSALCGLSLRLTAVQILRLVTGGPKDTDHGFGAEEGYVQEDAQEAPEEAPEEAHGGASADDGSDF